MHRLLIYIFMAAMLPVFGRFQEAVAYENGRVAYKSSLYGQKLGIVVCLAAATLLGAAVLRLHRKKQFKLRSCLSVTVALFALPALWNNWAKSQFGLGDIYTEVTSGIGGPMAWPLFLAAAPAFIAAEAYFRANSAQPP
jgi:hypothetical protein